MRRLLTPALLIIIAIIAAVQSGCGGSNDSNISAVSDCPGKTTNKGRAVIRVNGSDCIIADSGITVIARGEAIVSAHGEAAVDAADKVTVIVHNSDVRCNIRGSKVTVVNAIEGGMFNDTYLHPSCKRRVS